MLSWGHSVPNDWYRNDFRFLVRTGMTSFVFATSLEFTARRVIGCICLSKIDFPLSRVRSVTVQDSRLASACFVLVSSFMIFERKRADKSAQFLI